MRATPFPSFSTPAGVPTGTMDMPTGSLDLTTPWGQQGTQHILSPFHQARPNGVTPTGWKPREASVRPNADAQAAGMCSYIDNTMRFAPLKQLWGKTRQFSNHEGAAPYRVLPEHTLAAIRSPHPAPALESAEAMPSVLSKYAPAVAVFEHKYDPSRLNSGFISSPASLGKTGHGDLSASASMGSLSPQTPSPNAHVGSQLRKFQYDQTASLAHIPVARRTLAL